MDEFTTLLLKIVVAVGYLIVFIRLMGRKETKQSTPTDLMFIFLLTSIAWDMTFEPKYSILHIFVAMSLLTVIVFVIEWVTYKFPKVQEFVIGKPIIVIFDGKWDFDVLERERFTKAELEAKLRQKGISHVHDVQIGILEVSGDLSIKRKGKTEWQS
ncbi:DUF421 domain-containing protein [bacterium LRH843]|nr:DUF421 domain-containing protein [bacterium LRH843]